MYRNELDDNIDFFPSEFYSSSDPPPGWPPVPVPPNTFPKAFTYRNIGEIVNVGFEFGINASPARGWTTFANYSWQDDPEAKGIARDEINTPPRHRVNLGGAYNHRHFMVSSDLSFVDNAFWTDVLDARFWGPTESYRQWNARAGVRLLDDRAMLSVVATNLLNEDIQQHIFGDIIVRRIGGEVPIHLLGVRRMARSSKTRFVKAVSHKGGERPGSLAEGRADAMGRIIMKARTHRPSFVRLRGTANDASFAACESRWPHARICQNPTRITKSCSMPLSATVSGPSHAFGATHPSTGRRSRCACCGQPGTTTARATHS